MDVFFMGETSPTEDDGFRIGVRAGASLLECTISPAAVAAASGRTPRTPSEAVEIFRRHERRFRRVAIAVLSARGDTPPVFAITAEDVNRQAR